MANQYPRVWLLLLQHCWFCLLRICRPQPPDCTPGGNGGGNDWTVPMELELGRWGGGRGSTGRLGSAWWKPTKAWWPRMTSGAPTSGATPCVRAGTPWTRPWRPRSAWALWTQWRVGSVGGRSCCSASQTALHSPTICEKRRRRPPTR